MAIYFSGAVGARLYLRRQQKRAGGRPPIRQARGHLGERPRLSAPYGKTTGESNISSTWKTRRGTTCGSCVGGSLKNSITRGGIIFRGDGITRGRDAFRPSRDRRGRTDTPTAGLQRVLCLCRIFLLTSKARRIPLLREKKSPIGRRGGRSASLFMKYELLTVFAKFSKRSFGPVRGRREAPG